MPVNEKSVMPAEEESIFSASYWKCAAGMLKNTRMLIFAALIIALRVAVKFFKIPLAADLSLSFDCYVNAVGAVVYGPVAALLVGAVSDTLGCLIAPSGPYFFPFIFVEMSSGLIFALFLWKRKCTVNRVLMSKFTVNFVCNIVLNSPLMKWYYAWLYGTEKVYNLLNLVRIVKNLVLFPLEAALICMLFSALLPVMSQLRMIPKRFAYNRYDAKRLIIQILITFVLSVGLVLLYIFFLKDFVKDNNIKLW